MSARRIALAAAFVCVSGVAGAQDALAPIRNLYASAEYEQALSAIGRIRTEPGISTIDVDRYQVLCLFALGRSDEARQAIESVVTTDPLYRPADGDAAPSVRAAYSEVRRRLLPGLARQLYADAKAVYDRKVYPEAAEKLDRTLRVIDDPDAAGDASLADLRLVVAGFLDLSRTAEAAESTAAAARASAPPAKPEPPPAPVLVAPVVVRQEMPKWVLSAGGGVTRGEFRGAVEVEIDERGNVAAATITEPIHPTYDPLLLEAARDWKYQPARRDGKPVRAKKRVDILLRDR